MRRNWAFAGILAVLVVAAGCRLETTESGWLGGHVTIGPLAPVAQQGVAEPTPAPEVYAERQVVVFTADGQQEVLRAVIDPTGNYRVALQPGSYLVDINHAGIDLAKDLPVIVEIVANQDTLLDINIDTGIR